MGRRQAPQPVQGPTRCLVIHNHGKVDQGHANYYEMASVSECCLEPFASIQAILSDRQYSGRAPGVMTPVTLVFHRFVRVSSHREELRKSLQDKGFARSSAFAAHILAVTGVLPAKSCSRNAPPGAARCCYELVTFHH